MFRIGEVVPVDNVDGSTGKVRITAVMTSAANGTRRRLYLCVVVVGLVSHYGPVTAGNPLRLWANET